MNEARKRRDQARTLLLSTILSDVQNRELELKHPASDDEAAARRLWQISEKMTSLPVAG